MVCYSIVLGAAICMQGFRHRVQNRLPHTNVLSLMLWGGSIALLLDHFMNGELFLLSGFAWELLVGFVMVLGILTVWGMYVVLSKTLNKPREHRA